MIKRYFLILTALLLFANTVYAEEITLDKDTPAKTVVQTPVIPQEEYKEVSALALVDAPAKYLNKPIKIKAKFDKFTALGLDYPPVKRDAKTYISFLIKRENVTAYNIPLSELKLIVKRDYAEKEMVNVEQGDDIIIYGSVFSTAIGDPWVNVDRVTCITQHKDKDKDKNNDNDKKEADK